MHWLRINHTSRVVVSALCIWVACCAAASAEPVQPEFSTLKRLVRQYFYNARTGNKPILLTQSQILDLMESLRGMHIYIPGRNQIARSFPHDREFFARFILDELAHEPACKFPDDPTFLLQRIDAMCTSHESIRQLMRLAGRGESLCPTWIPADPLFPSLESARLQDLLDEHGVENATQASPRRRNYTIEHLLDVLESVYNTPAAESTTAVTSFDTLGR
ncbi:hypothetical protein Pan97_31480 [Bremerella volcania]|uniref:DUF1549 domain-containing protein n=1 Tax=Bremerella volcania TaxID=2527984 RepID=A0A518CA53_9BACT|nr:hypothetical protein [Bremerella volcania]QDU76103.1 hypothetical protein Pan97_31480 [Bremerella volcania]